MLSILDDEELCKSGEYAKNASVSECTYTVGTEKELYFNKTEGMIKVNASWTWLAQHWQRLEILHEAMSPALAGVPFPSAAQTVIFPTLRHVRFIEVIVNVVITPGMALSTAYF